MAGLNGAGYRPSEVRLLDRFGDSLLQCLPAVSHGFGIRRVPAGFWRQPQGDDPGAGGVPGGATQRHGVLVERYPLDVGLAEALYSRRTKLHGDGTAVLGHGHRRLLQIWTAARRRGV